ncbi:hypothetical protein F5B22DRAFT_658009 [Xylaria bambusicola]|uniref:uncharacterized protein n=1 Tax=Xylaria bambusicola TaxID=326684 RepID=UPI0020074458|nr:uncharacterized protein F5B22DRAFT_658009 [Xylaria bambusicola]KAI0509650.1 hypothetical protein F5B22DRAFT_658009 [Xylaria bambusicola]
MSSVSRFLTLLGVLGVGVRGAKGGAFHHFPEYNTTSYSTTVVTLPTTYETCPTRNVTVISPTTLISTTTVHLPPIISNLTVTVTVPETVTVTSTASYTTVVPTTSLTTVIVPTTITPPVSHTTDITTITPPVSHTTDITTITPPVSYTTDITTVTISEEDNECPTTCSLVASTVQLVFWPTSNDYTYPSTYVATDLDYTFTSPSVYLLISTIYGTDSVGRAGPSGTNKVFALDLDQISTIVPKAQITRQLTLNDLHTNCPQSEDPEVIATTIPDGHCDFSLLAPEPVKQWALPCNACGRLGLFDPPYAVPPLDGGIIGPTITTTSVDTTTFMSTTSASSGPTTTIVTATTTTPVSQATETESTTSVSEATSGSQNTETGVTSSIGDPTTIATASASKLAGMCGTAWLLVSCVIILYL